MKGECIMQVVEERCIGCGQCLAYCPVKAITATNKKAVVNMQKCTEVLVEKAVNGDKQALEDLILSVKDKVYNLSLRMLWNPADAEDVTQEILIKIITNLSKFRSESKFTTWVYRIAQNHLINIKKRGLENLNLSFEDYEKGIEVGLDKEQLPISDVERNLLAEELKVSCTHAMLLCLDRESRIIYILSSMFGVNSVDGGYIMDIKPEAYRKRLSRIREKMKNFMENNCGLVNPDKLCRCKQRRIQLYGRFLYIRTGGSGGIHINIQNCRYPYIRGCISQCII
jgi:RNA polymerase sigma factor (sigma-70 family)